MEYFCYLSLVSILSFARYVKYIQARDVIIIVANANHCDQSKCFCKKNMPMIAATGSGNVPKTRSGKRLSTITSSHSLAQIAK